MNLPKEKSSWFLYILKCRDGSLYTGITTDIDKRVTAHNEGRGARFTSGRTPVKLLYYEKQEDRSKATKREREVKKLTRQQKLALIARD